ncbi:SRPBCC domain-containing protein [Paenibacillus septentrionalis]|uniref:SRPBCC domain-containing protein n=1 Tax=Paenibacillus septentrionalis TaxID=429342 RepID=A0ABW1V7Y6_9BACL
MNSKRIDSASRVIEAPPTNIYHAFIDPKAFVSWLPPQGMVGELEQFQPFEGGQYRMTLYYVDTDNSSGKTTQNSDVVQATFLELIKDEKIVHQIEFESDDPAYAGKMNMSWSFHIVPEGTKVTIICEDVPQGISQKDHEEGLNSTLANLANYLKKLS